MTAIVVVVIVAEASVARNVLATAVFTLLRDCGADNGEGRDTCDDFGGIVVGTRRSGRHTGHSYRGGEYDGDESAVGHNVSFPTVEVDCAPCADIGLIGLQQQVASWNKTGPTCLRQAITTGCYPITPGSGLDFAIAILNSGRLSRILGA